MFNKPFLTSAAVLAAALLAYLLCWPTGVQPVAWQPQPSPGYSGPFARNERLAGLEVLPLGAGAAGPEHVAQGPDGRMYTALNNGQIVRLRPDGQSLEPVADTGGRVLGFDFDREGNLIAADAYKGLLRVSPQGQVSVITTQVSDGDPIAFADAVAVAQDGRIYFTEASHRFQPGPWGDPMAVSLAEILEQRGNGRVLVHDPLTHQTEVIATGLVFANGLVLTEDGQALLVVETGRYRIWRIPVSARHLDVRTPGQTARVLLDNLPAFPDNLTRGESGRYWVGLPKPRSALADALAPWPFVRAASFRLPHFLLPVPKPYGHALAFNEQGQILIDLQDPSGRYPEVTGITEAKGTLYVHSLSAPALGMRRVAEGELSR
jgi:sugar lactone lactonase YvrE